MSDIPKLMRDCFHGNHPGKCFFWRNSVNEGQEQSQIDRQILDPLDGKLICQAQCIIYKQKLDETWKFRLFLIDFKVVMVTWKV